MSDQQEPAEQAPELQEPGERQREEPEAGLAVTVAALAPEVRRVHLAVLSRYAETGRPPTVDELARLVGGDGADPAAVLAELTERDVVLVNGAGLVTSAYPFSTLPTAHRVRWEGGPEVYSMCAVDALGISAMLDRPVVISSAEPGTGIPVTVEVDGEAAVWDPPTTAVFIGKVEEGCGGTAAERVCGFVNFFTSPEVAEEWTRTRPEISGYVLEQDKALAYAIKQFGDLMRPGASEGPPANE
ncbi:MAG: alkylmercury lyase family protein [Micromonosporaceae bacterium]